MAVWAAFDTVYASGRRPRGRFGAPQTEGMSLFVHAARRPAGATFDAGVDVAAAGRDCTKHLGCNPEAKVAVGRNGNAVAIWQQDASPAQTFGDSSVHAARFTAPRRGGA